MIGKQLQLLRTHLGLSQGELARLAGVSKFTVLNWELGKRTPRPDKLQKLESAFNIKIDSIRIVFDRAVAE